MTLQGDRSMNYLQETIELLIYLENMGNNGTYEAKYDFIKKLS